MSTSQSVLSTKRKSQSTEVDLPKDVNVSLQDNTLVMTGPLGKVQQDFAKIPVDVKINELKIVLTTSGSRRSDNAVLNTAKSLVRNGLDGVRFGYEYKLKVIFAHFPVTVKVQGKYVHVENFYGERSPRVAEIIGDTKVSVQGEDVTVSGVSIKDVGQTAANLEQATTVKRKDQRVFLDGVYVYERTRKKGT